MVFKIYPINLKSIKIKTNEKNHNGNIDIYWY